MAAQGFPVQGLLSGAGGLGVRLLRLAQPGALGPGDPPRWLTDAIRQVHAGSRQTYGSRRSMPSSPWAAASASATTPWSC
jgi:hypothetical protein